MNFEEYAQQMCSKYKLAVSVAVIKNKPDHISVEQYLEQLKIKAESRTETNDSTLICSGDFNIDDDDFDVDHDPFIVNEFNTSFTTDEALVVETKSHKVESKDREIIPTRIHESVDLLQNFAISVGENDRNNEEMMKDAEITILSNVSVDDGSLEEVLQTLRGIDEDETLSHAQHFYTNTQEVSQIIPCNSFTNFNGEHFEYNITICDELENDYVGVINLPSNNNKPVTVNEELRAKVEKNLNKIMTSAEDVTKDKIVSNENIFGETDVFKNTYEMEVDVALNEIREATKEQKCNSTANEFSYPSTQFCKLKEKIPTNIADFKNTYELEVDIALKEIHDSKQHYESKADSAKDKIETANTNICGELNNLTSKASPEILENSKIIANVNEDHNIRAITIPENSTQDTILYTLPDFTHHASYISQSQYQNIEIPQIFIHGNNATSYDANNGRENNISETSDRKNNYENPSILTIDSSSIQYIIDQSGKTYAVLSSTHLDKTTAKFKADDTKKETKSFYQNKGNTLSQETFDENIVSKKSQKMGPITDELDFSDNENGMEKEIDMEDDLDVEMESEEVVPFKVVKELSKIKAYLSRRDLRGSLGLDGTLSDSGYKSDSQSSFKSGKALDLWLGQAGQCLWEYLARCPLRPASAHIDAEISQVLGALVDRLHAQETQPEFVEQLLEGVGGLLRGLGAGGGGDTLVDVDEAVERLVLLNASARVLEYSLHKTTAILERLHAQFTSKDNLFELTDITHVENSRHIFYILEIFIQMYDKNKDVTSQSATQNSQEKVLKRSSMAEIWRRKWNDNTSEAKSAGVRAGASEAKSASVWAGASEARNAGIQAGASEARSAGIQAGASEDLARCGAVLNRLVVDCMDGYSLVSFAALQCFNMLHA